MEKNKDTENLADSLHALSELFSKLPSLQEVQGDGWVTAKQMGDTMGTHRDTARKKLDDAVRKGTVESMVVRGSYGQKQRVYRPL